MNFIENIAKICVLSKAEVSYILKLKFYDNFQKFFIEIRGKFNR